MREITQPKYILTILELAKLTGDKSNHLLKCFEEENLIKMSGGKTGIPPDLVKKYLMKKGLDYNFKVLAYVNMKGGVGKTTSTVSTATRAVQYGFKTCILDMDSQGSASLVFDMMPGDDDPIFCDIWQNPVDMVMGSIKKIQDDLYILPSCLDNGLLDLSLVNPAAQKNAVLGVCNILKENGFDLVVIDSPPSLGTAVISTICATDILVIPVCSDAFSLKGLKLTLSETESICSTFNMEMPDIKILYTKFDKRESISENSLNRIACDHKEYLFPIPIRTSSEFSKVLENHETVFATSKQSNARDDYDQYVKSLLGIDAIFK